MTTDVTLEGLLQGSDAPLVVATRGSIRFLIFNRPRVRNALSVEVRLGFGSACQEAERDPAVKLVVVTGAGGAFSAGVDLKERAGGYNPPIKPLPGEAARSISKPTIAAVDGPCVTGALEIALSCSFIVASSRALFADTHAKVNLFPAWGMSALLPRAIGIRRARQMSLSSAFIDARRAYDWGLVNEVVEPERLLPRTLEIAEAILANSEASAQRQLALINRMEGEGLEACFAAELRELESFRAQRDAGG